MSEEVGLPLQPHMTPIIKTTLIANMNLSEPDQEAEKRSISLFSVDDQSQPFGGRPTPLHATAASRSE